MVSRIVTQWPTLKDLVHRHHRGHLRHGDRQGMLREDEVRRHRKLGVRPLISLCCS